MRSPFWRLLPAKKRKKSIEHLVNEGGKEHHRATFRQKGSYGKKGGEKNRLTSKGGEGRGELFLSLLRTYQKMHSKGTPLTRKTTPLIFLAKGVSGLVSKGSAFSWMG